MNNSEQHPSELLDAQESEDPLSTDSQKDSLMSDDTHNKPFSLSCWWSRGPAGQVQEWESRPTASELPPRTYTQHRPSSARLKRNTMTPRKIKA